MKDMIGSCFLLDDMLVKIVNKAYAGVKQPFKVV